jgi:putative glycosyltransferase (TIGR04372 family)
LGQTDRSTKIPRNASIQTYIEGIKVITAAGGWVVRIGDPTMTTLPQMDRVIDYPHTRFKSELMDIYLMSQCSFLVGTNSGPADVAFLFQTRMLLINIPDWFATFSTRRGDVVIVKHIFSRSRGRFLSIQEILDEPHGLPPLSPMPDDHYLVDNSPEEIRDVIEEFLTTGKDYQHTELQEVFNHGLKRQMDRWFQQTQFETATSEGPGMEAYRFASRAHPIQCAVGQRYLKQNWLVDNLEKSSF